jgi:hypothetical protein
MWHGTAAGSVNLVRPGFGPTARENDSFDDRTLTLI